MTHSMHIWASCVCIRETRPDERLGLLGHHGLWWEIHPVGVHDHLLPEDFLLESRVRGFVCGGGARQRGRMGGTGMRLLGYCFRTSSHHEPTGVPLETGRRQLVPPKKLKTRQNTRVLVVCTVWPGNHHLVLLGFCGHHVFPMPRSYGSVAAMFHLVRVHPFQMI